MSRIFRPASFGRADEFRGNFVCLGILVLEFWNSAVGPSMANCSKMPIMHGRWLATSSEGPLRKATTRSLPSWFRTDEVTTSPARRNSPCSVRPAIARTCFPPGSLSPFCSALRCAGNPAASRADRMLPLPLIRSPSSHGFRRKTPEHSSLLACAARFAANQPFGYRIVRPPASSFAAPRGLSFGGCLHDLRMAVLRQSPFHPGAADAFPTACRIGRLLAFAQPPRVEESQPPRACMNISAPFIRRPVATTLLTAAVALAGAIAYKQLPVAPLPQVDFPTI